MKVEIKIILEDYHHVILGTKEVEEWKNIYKKLSELKLSKKMRHVSLNDVIKELDMSPVSVVHDGIPLSDVSLNIYDTESNVFSKVEVYIPFVDMKCSHVVVHDGLDSIFTRVCFTGDEAVDIFDELVNSDKVSLEKLVEKGFSEE